MKTVAEVYCENHGVRLADFEHVVLRRCLPPAAWVARGGLRIHKTDYFAPDFDLVRRVGSLHHAGEIVHAVAGFDFQPDNQGWLRGRLRLRISVARLLRLLLASLPDEPKPAHRVRTLASVRTNYRGNPA